MNKALREVLQTFVCYRPDIGYIQGMTYLGASLLLYMDDEYEVFRCLANLLSRHLIDFYRFEMNKVAAHCELASKAVKQSGTKAVFKLSRQAGRQAMRAVVAKPEIT